MKLRLFSLSKFSIDAKLFSYFSVLIFWGWMVCSSDVAKAEDYNSSNFILRDPIFDVGGGNATSSNFELYGSLSQLTIEESSSTNFIGRSGFLYFPTYTSPVVSATAGDAQVSLSWTAITAKQDAIASYDVGQGTTNGGPYTYSNVGNILSSTRTSLTNGTTYYFIVRGVNGSGERVVTSSQVSSVPVAPSPSPTPPSPSPSPSGGGGGGGSLSEGVVTRANFSGRAYPNSKITLLKDGQLVVTTVAGPDAKFEISLSNLSGGSYVFSIYGEDKDGRRSMPFTFPISLTPGAITNIGGIFISPSIDIDKSQVKRGDNLAIFGQSVPQSDIVILVNSIQEYFVKSVSDKDGVYLYYFDTSPLELGAHSTKSKSAIEGEISPFGKSVDFTVGTKNIGKTVPKSPEKGDLNNDGRVNLVDFSIAAYWYKRPLTEAAKVNVDDKLYPDGKVDLRDFSILAYYWTG